MAQLPTEVNTWLLDRGITQQVILDFKLGWDGNRIIIPVHDVNGNFLFNKYRRSPFSDEGPKYMYDRGATSALYGINNLLKLNNIILCEGELDALRLRSLGYNGVSSTGGSATFKQEWATLLKGYHIYICYDSDEPGIRGAFNVQVKIPWARIIWLPKEFKDITDFFVGKCWEDFLPFMEKAKTYDIPLPLRGEWPTTKKGIKDLMKGYELRIGDLMNEARALRGEYKSDRHLEILKKFFMDRYYEAKKHLRYMDMGKNKVQYGNRIAQAKQVSIGKFIDFNREKFAVCVWHQDSHPSMYWYENQGRVKCFSCGQLGDVIDVVQKLNNCELKEALNIILQ